LCQRRPIAQRGRETFPFPSLWKAFPSVFAFSEVFAFLASA
jgi:hypothetical protein